MNIELGTSNQGRPTLIYQGYEYVKKQETIIKMPKDHICDFKTGATEARQAKNKMKEKALTTTNYVIIASTLQEIQNDVATQMNLSPQETIVKSLYRYNSYYCLVLCVFHFFFKRINFLNNYCELSARVLMPRSGHFQGFFLHFPAATRFFQTPGSWNL